MSKLTCSPKTTRSDSIHTDGTLIDRYGRHITYVRLSVTDRCDFRCQYCMPLKVKFLPKKDVLSLEQLLKVGRVFSKLGVKKIRVTGGEPLVRPNVTWLCQQLAALPAVEEVAITTNGSQLPKLADDLVAAKVRRVNISLDSLSATKFQQLTRTGDLSAVLAGVEAARAAHFSGGVKINTVMMKGFNDCEIPQLATYALEKNMDISFIEEMPLGEVGYRRSQTYYSATDALRCLERVFTLKESTYNSGGPARYWDVEGFKNRIGFITPHSHNFCQSCNRVRVSATGDLFPCLGQNDAINLRSVLQPASSDFELEQLISEAMQIKPKGHDFDIHADGAQVIRFMSATGG